MHLTVILLLFHNQMGVMKESMDTIDLFISSIFHTYEHTRKMKKSACTFMHLYI